MRQKRWQAENNSANNRIRFTESYHMFLAKQSNKKEGIENN